jgi:hypothetical protein
MSGLEPADPANGTARIDARSFAIPETPHEVVPDVDSPVSADQTDPSVMQGQQWVTLPVVDGPAPAARNAFEAKLTGASSVRLCLMRMHIDASKTIDGDVTTEKPLTLELRGAWKSMPIVTIDAQTVGATRPSKDVLAIDVPAGRHELSVSPR